MHGTKPYEEEPSSKKYLLAGIAASVMPNLGRCRQSIYRGAAGIAVQLQIVRAGFTRPRHSPTTSVSQHSKNRAEAGGCHIAGSALCGGGDVLGTGLHHTAPGNDWQRGSQPPLARSTRLLIPTFRIPSSRWPLTVVEKGVG